MSRKKLISIVCTLALLVGFFCVPEIVHAEDSRVRYIRTYTGNISSASLTYSATAMQFNYNTETALEGGVESPILITCRITNNGSNDVKIANSYVELDFSSTVLIQNVDIYTSDLMVQLAGTAGQTTPRYNIIASNDFNYNGHIVIPHNSTLYLIFEVDIRGYVDTSNSTITGPYLDAIFIGIQSSDVQTGDFVTGLIPRELQEVERLLGISAGTETAINNNIGTLITAVGNVKNLLTEIKSIIQFTGTYSQVNGNGSGSNLTTVTFPNTGAEVSIGYRMLKSYYLTDDVEISGSNSTISSGTRVTPAIIFVKIYNPYLHVISTYTTWTISNLPNYSWEIKGFYSDDFSQPYFYNNNSIYLILKNKLNSSGYISNIRDHYTCILVNIYNSATEPAPSASEIVPSLSYTREAAIDDLYIPASEYYVLRDLYLGLVGDSAENENTGDASDDAGALSDQIHQQEETWYDENSAAMEAVGLSSYRFTNQQASGILGVTTQFEQLWLALGNWNLVYIFVLMASLATFILRHEPSTRVKQMREMYMTDRAVARDWEMRTNPEKFSHRRWVENNRRH